MYPYGQDSDLFGAVKRYDRFLYGFPVSALLTDICVHMLEPEGRGVGHFGEMKDDEAGEPSAAARLGGNGLRGGVCCKGRVGRG